MVGGCTVLPKHSLFLAGYVRDISHDIHVFTQHHYLHDETMSCLKLVKLCLVTTVVSTTSTYWRSTLKQELVGNYPNMYSNGQKTTMCKHTAKQHLYSLLPQHAHVQKSVVWLHKELLKNGNFCPYRTPQLIMLRLTSCYT